MNEFNIKSKTCGKCRVYPDNPQGLAPSVTSICGALMKYGLIDWAANCAVDYIINANFTMEQAEEVFEQARYAHEQIRDDAADFGTLAHLLCQLWLENKDRELDDEFEKSPQPAKELFLSFQGWCNKNKIEPVHTEIKLHGDGYSGRCDLIAYRTCPKTGERRLGLYDIKTGKGSYYPEWGLQLAAYAEAHKQSVCRDVEKKYYELCDKFPEKYDISKGKITLLDYWQEEEHRLVQEIGIIKLNKDTLKCNFSEQSKPKFTADRDRLTKAWVHLVKFYWEYNDLAKQFEEIQNISLDNDEQL